jgi:hypothetical protein
MRCTEGALSGLDRHLYSLRGLTIYSQFRIARLDTGVIVRAENAGFEGLGAVRFDVDWARLGRTEGAAKRIKWGADRTCRPSFAMSRSGE